MVLILLHSSPRLLNCSLAIRQHAASLFIINAGEAFCFSFDSNALIPILQ
jgi:hypothetical protein